MDYRDRPTADVPILLFLITATVIFGIFAGGLVWLQQPYVLQAAVQADDKAPRPSIVDLPSSNALALELEERATLAANEANAELGLQRPQQLAYNDAPGPTARPQPAAKPAPPKAKPKPRQVARKQAPAVAERRPWQQDGRSFGAFWFGPPRSFFN